MQTIVHYSLHLLAPGLIAYLFFPRQWLRIWIILLATMLVDLDHLLATPIFAPDRCSINFHPLHTWPAMVVYVMGLGFSTTRIISIGLCLHMLTDALDCWWMGGF